MATTDRPTFNYGGIPVGYYDRMLRQGGGIRRLWHTLKFERVLDYLPEADGGALLDIGCFAGSFLSMVPRHRFERQVGVDILPEQIEYARHNYGTAFRTFQVSKGITQLGDVGEPFDAVTLIEVIEHLRHDEIVGLFQELDRVLKPGGMIIVTTPNYTSTWPLLEIVLNRVSDVSYDEQHITHFTYFSFERQLAKIYPPLLQNYDVEVKTTTHFLSPFLASVNYEIARGLARAVPHGSWNSPLGNLILTVLRKKKALPEGRAVTRARRDWLIAVALLAFGAVAYALVVVQDYSGSLIGGEDYDGQYRGDANYFEFLGYYVRDHWHFGLKPISFFTTDVAFPTGTHIGLLSWCAERDLFHALMLKIAGPGPWIQTYVTLGAWLGAIGVTAILRPQYGILRAALVGYAASFMAFYAWYKYPYHVNMVAIHWVLMSIAADAITIRRIADGKRLTTPFILLRAALIVMSVGLDLGYIAGHALTSLTVTTYCAWGELGKRDKRILRRFRLAFPEHPLDELRASWLESLGATTLMLFGLVLYVPLVLAVVKDTATYPMTDPGGNFWANQLHALFPYFPGTHPNSRLVRAIFGKDEGIGEYAPGFTLLLAGFIGIKVAHAKDVTARIKPFLITALLIFAFHPRWTKTLQIFPWFAYDRVAGRGTIVLPILLALIGVSIDEWPKLAKRVLFGLAAIEIFTALFLVNNFHPSHLTPAEKDYFTTIKAAPGKGLLDWPFCIASANGVITRELCPYYDHLATSYAYRRFHEKSTVGIYLSRAHPSQFKSWLDDGWEHMFMPDDATRMHSHKETRCFDDTQWKRFDDLYRSNDFAGIQLYVDLLQPECVTQFHERYGQPRAMATFPRLGHVEFLER